MSDIASLVAKLSMNSSEFTRGINQARGDLGNLSKSANMVKGAVASFLTFAAAKQAFDWVKDGIQKLDDLAAQAERVGVSAQALKELQYAAELSDTSAEDLNAALLKMNKILGDASEEGGKTAAVLSGRIGKSLEEIAKQGPERTFLDVADAISKIEDPMARAAAVTDIFGKSGQALITTLNRGAGGIQALRSEARSFYGTDLNALSERAGLADDAFKRLGAAWEGLKFEFAAGTSETLVDYLNLLADTIKNVVTPSVRYLSDSWREVRDDMEEIGAVIGGILGGASREEIGRDLKIMEERRKESRSAAAAGPPVIGGMPASDIEAAGKRITIKNPAIELNTKEGFSVIARALSGRTAKGPDEGVKAADRTTKAVEKVESAVKGLGKMPAAGPAF
jgi:exonuclease VII small subunit